VVLLQRHLSNHTQSLHGCSNESKFNMLIADAEAGQSSANDQYGLINIVMRLIFVIRIYGDVSELGEEIYYIGLRLSDDDCGVACNLSGHVYCVLNNNIFSTFRVFVHKFYIRIDSNNRIHVQARPIFVCEAT
jgi:hypothetical protein